MFSFVGYVSMQSGVPIEEMPLKGMELGFVVYPNLLNSFPFPHLWCIIFFAMLTSLGLASEYVFIEAVSNMIYGTLKRSKLLQRSQTFVTAILCGILLLVNLIFFASGAGYYWLETVDHYATGINLVVFLFVQLYALVYLLPLSDLESKVNNYGEKFPKLYDFCLRYICPAFALFLSLTAIVNEFKREHRYNSFIEFLVCWVIFLTPISLFVLFYFWDPFDRSKPVKDIKFQKIDKLLEEESLASSENYK